MGIAERKQRQKGEVKASILQAAWQLVEKEGWQSLSIRKIADAIEYSAPVIYDHFANKEAIMLEFTKRGFQQLNEQLIRAKEKFEPRTTDRSDCICVLEIRLYSQRVLSANVWSGYARLRIGEANT